VNPEQLRFAKTHEWISVDGEVATVGISDFAVQLLTDIVYLSLPRPGAKYAAGDSMGEIESVKAVSDIYAPVSGEVLAVNESLPDNLAQLSDSPFDAAWILKLKVSDPAEVNSLLTWSAYKDHCSHAEH
jgi:glycine cleavage system H protein